MSIAGSCQVFSGFCGATMNHICSRAEFCRIWLAMIACPMWMGLNDPPKIPIFMALLLDEIGNNGFGLCYSCSEVVVDNAFIELRGERGFIGGFFHPLVDVVDRIGAT